MKKSLYPIFTSFYLHYLMSFKIHIIQEFIVNIEYFLYKRHLDLFIQKKIYPLDMLMYT